MSTTGKDSRPWVADGDRWVKHEDMLIGNAEGLASLRDHIDQAIRSGSAEVTEPGIQFTTLRVVQADPREKQTPWLREKLRMLSYALGGSLLAVLLALGVKGLIDLLK